MEPQAAIQRPSEKSQEAVTAGVHLTVDPAGRHWRVRVFPIGELWRFQNLLLATILAKDGKEEAVFWPLFLYHVLMMPEPLTWRARVRRHLGLPDYSYRFIKRKVELKSALFIRDEACRATLDQSFDAYMQRMIDAANEKKNLMNQSGANS